MPGQTDDTPLGAGEVALAPGLGVLALGVPSRKCGLCATRACPPPAAPSTVRIAVSKRIEINASAATSECRWRKYLGNRNKIVACLEKSCSANVNACLELFCNQVSELLSVLIRASPHPVCPLRFGQQAPPRTPQIEVSHWSRF
jgi:hypothetical protein